MENRDAKVRTDDVSWQAQIRLEKFHDRKRGVKRDYGIRDSSDSCEDPVVVYKGSILFRCCICVRSRERETLYSSFGICCFHIRPLCSK